MLRNSFAPLLIASLAQICSTSSPATAQTPAATQAPETHNIPGTGVNFRTVYIPGGLFMMGSDPSEAGRSEDEGPLRSVSVDPFWIGEYEVSYDEWVIFRFTDRDRDTTAVEGRIYDVDAVARPSQPYEDPSHSMGGPGRPAVGMTQWGALHYAHWVSEKTGLFFRLPTEAEWEYACRAGGDAAFPFGTDESEIGDYAWYSGNSDNRLHRLGKKKPNAWGVYDMHGNAAEWTLDQYEEGFYSTLTEELADNPWREPTRLHPRTVRGGAYDDPAPLMRCASRLESSLNWKMRDPQIPKSFWWNTDSPFLGFRLVRPAVPPSPDEQEYFWSYVLGE